MNHNPYLKFVMALLCLCLAESQVQAQYASYPVPEKNHAHLYVPNMDTDIALIRANGFPELRFHVDDYLHYSPAVVMLGMKAFGYEGRSSWERMLVSDAFSSGIVVAGTKGLKYLFQRTRPDGSSRDAFPSGHTAIAFSLATMLHLEYGGRSPWFSIGAYSVAASTALMRILNNRHWMSDTFAGALVGIGATRLGYYIGDQIFSDRQLTPGYAHPEFFYDASRKEWQLDLMFHRRFVLGRQEMKQTGSLPERGSGISLDASLPIVLLPHSTQSGAKLRAGMGSLSTQNIYNVLAGGYCRTSFNDRFSGECHLMAGWAHLTVNQSSNLDALAGFSIQYALSRSFQLKGWTEYEYIDGFNEMPAMHSILLGFSVGFCW